MTCCPCCDFRTLREDLGSQICPVCFWEDDGRRDIDPAAHRGGPHNLVTLHDARFNFSELGASDLLWIGEVRSPTPNEGRPD
jgi:hypothetical protein